MVIEQRYKSNPINETNECINKRSSPLKKSKHSKGSNTAKSYKNDANVKLTTINYKGGHNYIEQIDPTDEAKIMTINCDWFGCELKGQIINFDSSGIPQNMDYDNGVIQLIHNVDVRDSFYRYVFDVYLNGEKFLVLKADNYLPKVDSDSINCKIENEYLYQDGWGAMFDYVIETMGLLFQKISRLDIAIDGIDILDTWENVVSKKYETVGKATTSEHYGSKRKLQGFYIGKRGSDRYANGYNKSNELKKSGSNKTYIKQFWRLNNIDQSKDVQRFELRLRRKALKSIKNLDYKQLENSAYLAGIFKSQTAKFMELVEVSNDSNVTRKKRLQWIDWTYFDALETERLPRVDKPSLVWQAKRWIKFEFTESKREANRKDDNKILLDSISRCKETAIKYDLLEWLDSKIKDWNDSVKEVNKQRNHTQINTLR